MHVLSEEQLHLVSGGTAAYDAGYAVGELFGKTLIAVAVTIAIYTVVAT